VVGADDEGIRPQIWPPVSDRLDESNELVLIGREFGVVWRHGTTEERNRATALMQHDSEASIEHVAINHERLVEVGKLQNRGRCQRQLQGIEGRHHRRCPPEYLALQ
jgi:hypothetical protein